MMECHIRTPPKSIFLLISKFYELKIFSTNQAETKCNFILQPLSSIMQDKFHRQLKQTKIDLSDKPKIQQKKTKRLQESEIFTVSLISSPCKSCRMSRNRSNRSASYSTSLSSSETLAGARSLSCASIDAIFSSELRNISLFFSLRYFVPSISQ